MKEMLRKAVLATETVTFDSLARSGELTLRLRLLMQQYAIRKLKSRLVDVLDIFDKEGFEPYRDYYEKELKASYADGDNYIALGHTEDGQYLIGTY